jgi:hypothetical protein
MKVRSVIEWFQVIDRASDDLVVARMLFAELMGYEGKPYRSDLEQMSNLFAALRMDQVGKENRV